MLRTLRDALVSGFLILLPFLLAYILIGGFYDLLVLIAQPVGDVLPRYGLLPPWGRQLVQIGLLGAVFIVVGLSRHTAPVPVGWAHGSRPPCSAGFHRTASCGTSRAA